MEYKSLGFELKDLSRDKRTAIIAHAVYDNIDKVKDISRMGMFNKSWQESKDEIAFYLNHKDENAPGKVVDVFEDQHKAYTKVWLGTHTLGNDTLIMMDEGVIKKASFGYYVEKSNPLSIKGQMIRELKEVRHVETSVLTKSSANPLAGIVAVNKSIDVLNAVIELKGHLQTMESFCRNTTASDESIKSILKEIDEAKNILSKYDTADTQLITEPDASNKDNSFKRKLLLLKAKI
jgi:HK97 family phage prohead protease